MKNLLTVIGISLFLNSSLIAQKDSIFTKFNHIDSVRLSIQNDKLLRAYSFQKFSCRNCKWSNQSPSKYLNKVDSIKNINGQALNTLLSDKEENMRLLIRKYTLNGDSKLLRALRFYRRNIKINNYVLGLLDSEVQKSDNKIFIALTIDDLAINNNLPQRYGTVINRNSNPLTLAKPHLTYDKINLNRKSIDLNTVEEFLQLN